MTSERPVTTAPGEMRRYTADQRPPALRQWGGWVIHYPWLVWEYRDLVWNLARRELLGRFRGSVLGIFWVLAQPLFLFAVYYVIFGIVFAPRASPGGPAADPTFAVYLFAGVVAWGAFAGTILRTCTMVTDNANLVKHATFPSELLAVPLLLAELVVYAAGALVLIVVGTATGSIALTTATLTLPLLLVVHAILTVGIGLFLACLHVFLRDTAYAYGVFAIAWLFASPVFWRLDVLQAGPLGNAAILLTYNPAYPLLQAHRVVLGVIGSGDVWLHLGAAGLWGVIFMTMGYGIFVSRKHRFSDLV